MHRLPVLARVYVAASVAIAVAILAAHLATGHELAGNDLVLGLELFALAVAAKHWPLEYAPKRKLSLSVSIYLLAVLHSPENAVLFVCLAELAGQLVLSKRGQRALAAVLFNPAQQTIAAAAGSLPLLLFGRSAATIILAAAAMYLASSALVAGMAALTQKQPVWEVWWRGRRASAPQALLLTVAAIVTFYALSYPVLIPLLMAFPVAMVYAVWRSQRERAATHEAEARLAAEREKAEARGEFLSLASHELRTPITTLKGYAWQLAQMVGREDLDSSRLAQRARTIDQQATRLCALIEQLLDVTRIESGKLRLEPVDGDLAQRVAQVVADMRVGNGRRIEYSGPDKLAARFDAVRLDQVVMNLVANAIKFGPRDASITVRLAAEGETVRLVVRDRGPGIPPEKLPHIFDRYFQGHGREAVGGLGIGLYVSREIVEMHGGTISAANCADGGAEFTVCLPLSEELQDLRRAPALAPQLTAA